MPSPLATSCIALNRNIARAHAGAADRAIGKVAANVGFRPIADIRDNSHTEPMRCIALAIPLVLSACSTVENTFVVEDEQKSIVAATLVLCGSVTPLQRRGDRLVVSQSIDCEGSGHIRLRYASGDEHNCPVGYVTPGAEQNFTYRATEIGCR